MRKDWTKRIVGCAALLLGLAIALGGIAFVSQTVPTEIPIAVHADSDSTIVPPPGEYEWDCGCDCKDNPANDSTMTWMLILLGTILAAILIVLLFRKPAAPQAQAKNGKGDDSLSNMLMMSQPQAGYAAAPAPQPQAYVAPAAPQRESITDQMLGQARATVAASSGQRPATGIQRAGGTPTPSTAQGVRPASAPSTAQAPAPRAPIQQAPPSANQQ